MGTNGWRSDRPLRDQLFKTAYRFGFYQAVRLLEKLYPDRHPVGETSAPEKEAVRFSSEVSQVFPPSEIADIVPPDKDRDLSSMSVNFMGLAGSHGPLPTPYTELIIERKRKKDTALKEFLDIFNHRLISILYRVRKIFRPGFDLEHPEKSKFAWYFLSLMGIGTKGLRKRMAVSDQALLHYTALISQQPRSMCGLENLLSHYFGLPIRGKQLAGQWLRLESDQLTYIGASGRNRRLGESALLAFRVWEQQSMFRLHFANLGFSDYTSFLPPGKAWRPLIQLTTFYAGTGFDFELEFSVKAEEIPQTRIGASHGARLGWTTWIRSEETKKTDGNVGISPKILQQLKHDFGFDYERKTP